MLTLVRASPPSRSTRSQHLVGAPALPGVEQRVEKRLPARRTGGRSRRVSRRGSVRARRRARRRDRRRRARPARHRSMPRVVVRVGAGIDLFRCVTAVDNPTKLIHTVVYGSNVGSFPSLRTRAQPWRIHAIANDFRVEDVWALPTPGGPDDFARLVALMDRSTRPSSSPVVARTVRTAGALGGWLRPRPTRRRPGRARAVAARTAARRPAATPALADVRDRAVHAALRTDDEAALEIANQTVHGVLHLGWVPDGRGGYRGQMAVLVKPNGLLGTAYMAAIAPVPPRLVYPTMLRDHRTTLAAAPRAGRQVDVPDDIAALSTLPRVDYADAFVVDTGAHPDWTADTMGQGGARGGVPRRRGPGCWPAGRRSAEAPMPTDRSVLGWDVRRTGRGHRAARQGLADRDARRAAVRATPRGLLLRDVRPPPHAGDARRCGRRCERTHVRTVLALLERACRDTAAATSRSRRQRIAGRPGSGAAGSGATGRWTAAARRPQRGSGR